MKKTLYAFFLLFCLKGNSQLNYGSAASYGLRKLVPTYNGNAIQVIRSCDNATANIGFTSCGDLDTVSLKTFVLAANPLTQIASTADAAYSLRKVRCAYAGPAIRVRSTAAASPTMDIGFTQSGDLDTVALKTFVGANSAYVTTWYDQSTNAYHAVQSTTAYQPRVVNAGVIDKQNNRPALNFDGTDDFLQNNAYSLLLNCQTPTWNAVIFPISSWNAYTSIVSWRVAGGNTYQLELGPSNNWNTDWATTSHYTTTNGLTINYSAFQIVTSLYTSTSNGLYLNGTLSYSNTGQSNAAVTAGSPSGSGSIPLIIGNDNCCGGRFIKGYLFEVVLSSTNFSATDRQFLEWSQAQYYSVSGPVLGILPVSPASGSVTVWYDQSGAAKDAVQATAANEPRILTNGLIEKNGNIPAVNFAGTPQKLVAPLSTGSYPVSLSLIANTSGASTRGAFLKLGTEGGANNGVAIGVGPAGGNYYSGGNGTSLIALKEGVAWCPSSPTANYPATPFISSTIQNSGAGGMTSFLNGTNVPLSNAANAVGASITGSLLIGGCSNTLVSPSDWFPASKQSEVAVFGTALSSTRRTLLENNQAAYYNLSISNTKYTPPAAGSYCRFVTGVGRESATDSVAGTPVTVGMGISIGSGIGGFLQDNGDYITYGINCPITATTSTANVPPAIQQRWFNDWYLNKTDVSTNNGTLTVFFDFTDYGVTATPGPAVNYELLVRSSPAGTFSFVPVSAKSVSGNRVLFTVDASNLPGNAYYTIGTTNASSSALPIELISFQATCEEENAVITWATASQVNNAWFLLERSTNGTDYEVITKIKGAGTTNKAMNYAYTDADKTNGLAYYRLKQVDTDGSERNYGLVVSSCNTENNGFKIYPNPTSGSFILEGVGPSTLIRVFDARGRIVYEGKKTKEQQEINLDNLAAGVYYLKVNDASQPTVLKLVIQP